MLLVLRCLRNILPRRPCGLAETDINKSHYSTLQVTLSNVNIAPSVAT
ncbi:hypothetical protein CPter91_0267 [Collimonas pratensis]|uniref:Uncharacterized protein n=1 Tax=Collimonas pratensis TaxID=279113 RepID=A0A127PY21_9BURK|nr:hypothetical protein CPter91_0267 [Collimonas pratensis]